MPSNKPRGDDPNVNFLRLFAGRAEPSKWFADWIIDPVDQRRLAIFHGVGGIGKSWLLRAFEISAQEKGMATAVSSGQDAGSPVELLECWAGELRSQDAKCAGLDEVLQRFRSLRVKMNKQVGLRSGSNEKHGSGRGKVGDAVGGAALGAILGTVVPGAGGAIGSAIATSIGGSTREALSDWLSQFISRRDVDFFLDPVPLMSSAFRKDLARITRGSPVVLFIDAYEQADPIDRWVTQFAQDLPDHVRLVLAGRTLPVWDRTWPDWVPSAHVREVTAMSDREMAGVVTNYLASVEVGTLLSQPVDEIVAYARGLPLVAATAARLFATYGSADFNAIKPQVIQDLADRLLVGVPSSLRPALEAAATLRWFNVSLLRRLVPNENVAQLYEELLKLPSIRSRSEGRFVHDAVRDVLGETMLKVDPDRHRDLHRLAAEYYADELQRLRVASQFSDNQIRLARERLYHLVMAGEQQAADDFHLMFDEALGYFNFSLCRQLLSDIDLAHPTDVVLNHRAKFDRIRLSVTEHSPAFVDLAEFERLVEVSLIDPPTRWQVLLAHAGLTGFLTTRRDLEEELCRKSLLALKDIGGDRSRVGCLVRSQIASFNYNRPLEAEPLLLESLRISTEIDDRQAAYEPHLGLGHLYLEEQKFEESSSHFGMAIEIARELRFDALEANALNRLAQSLMASDRLDDAEAALVLAVARAERMPGGLGAREDKVMYIRRHLGALYQMKGDFGRATGCYEQSAATYRERRSTGGLARTLLLLAACQYEAGHYDPGSALDREISEVMTRAKLPVVQAAWSTLRGHVAIDRALRGDIDASRQATNYYFGALLDALPAGPMHLDEILGRVLGKLASARACGDGVSDQILEQLAAAWRFDTVDGLSGETRELQERSAASRNPNEFLNRGSVVLDRLVAGSQDHSFASHGHPWLDY